MLQLTAKDILVSSMRIPIAVSLLLSLPNPLLANEFHLSTGIEITSGDYNETENTDIIYTSLSARYAAGEWSVWVNLPFVSVSGPGLVFDANVAKLSDAPPRFLDQLNDFLAAAEANGFPVNGDAAGFGDLSIGALKTIELQSGRFYADLSAVLKIPTADKKKLLGAGVFEGTVQIDFIYNFDDFSLMGGGGRRFTQKSDVFPLNDSWIATAAIFTTIGPRATAGFLYDWRQAVVIGAAPASELTAFVSAPVGDRWSVVSYALVGFSDGSPNYGVGIRLSYDFEPRLFSRR